jgi:hypothetical protein
MVCGPLDHVSAASQYQQHDYYYRQICGS